MINVVGVSQKRHTITQQTPSVAHLTNFSFECPLAVFTQDASLHFWHNDAKNSKITKTQIKGSSLKF